MAMTTTHTSLPMSSSLDAFATPSLTARRRRIDRNAGRALEILGHAIEYLTDEMVNDGCQLAKSGGQLEAIQLLMAVNRQVYYECPQVPTLGERLLRFLGAAA